MLSILPAFQLQFAFLRTGNHNWWFDETETEHLYVEMGFRKTEIPFTLTLFAVSMTEAISHYNLSQFVSISDNNRISLATAGL